MRHVFADWDRLTAGVDLGDLSDVAEVRRRLEPHLTRLVRRSIDLRNDAPLDRQVRDVADRVTGAYADRPRPGPDGPEWVVGRVTRALCDGLIRGLVRARPAPGLCETVRGL